MKTIIATIVFLMGANAMACAGCLDIFPETIVMDSEATKSILTSHPKLQNQGTIIRLSEIKCTIPSYFGEEKNRGCSIDGSLSQGNVATVVKLDGVNASVLYSQLKNLTVEIDGRVDDEWKRTGRRTKVTLLEQSMDKFTAYIPYIHYGTLSCPVVNGKNRCEIELTVLNVSLLSPL